MKRRKRLAVGGVCVGIDRVATATGLEFMPRDRRRVLFAGRVQGVGFRFTCQSLARSFEVAGFVRNLPDGRVELVAEGESGELDAFLSSIRLEMSTYIKNVTTEPESPGAHPLTGFFVRH
jgi:acylphosphatase